MKLSLGISLPKLVLIVFFYGTLVSAMKFEDFKTCSQSGFCRRNREYADQVTESKEFTSPYTLVKDSILLSKDKIYADIKNTKTNVLLTLDLHILKDNTARVRINEKAPIKTRYDEHQKYTLFGEPELKEALNSETSDKGVIIITMDAQRKVVISPQPLRIEFLVDNEPAITLNERGFFNFEHLRTKESHQPKMIKKENEDGTSEMVKAPSEEGLWEETFKTWTDPKPNGNYYYYYYALNLMCVI